MKTFKEFQTESYSRLDEGWGTLINRGMGAYFGNEIYNTVGKDLASGDPERKVKKSNMKGRVASGIVGGLGDQIVKKGWKYGVKPAYGAAKWGVTKGIPGAVTTAGKIISAVGAMNKMR